MIVDGDPSSRQRIRDDVCSPRMEVMIAERSSDALTGYRSADIVLLGQALPDVNVLGLCQLIRGESSVPIIVIAENDDEVDLVLALMMGADDYIVRPYRRRELLARLEAAYRRAYGAPPLRQAVAPITTHETKIFGNVTLDLRSRRVMMGGREIILSRKEFDILSLLASDPGRTFTREQIMKEVWGHDGGGDTRTLGVHVTSLRKRVCAPGLIETVRGVGFRLKTQE